MACNCVLSRRSETYHNNQFRLVNFSPYPSTAELDRYRVWWLHGPGEYIGVSVADSLFMQLTLDENFIDIGPVGLVGWTVGQSAQVNFTATQVIPEPSTAVLIGIGLAGLATRRRGGCRGSR